MGRLRTQKGSRQEGASPPCECWPTLPHAGTGRHTGNVHLMWKGVLGPGRLSRLQPLPTQPGSDACGINHHGVEEVLFPCSPRQFKHLLVMCVLKQVYQEWTPRLALPQLSCEIVSFKLDATASKKHALKQETQGLIRFVLKGWYWHFQTSQLPACCFLLVWNWISVSW